VETAVTFRPLTRRQIRSYHARVNPLDKAGAYGIQEMGQMLVKAVRGSLTNVIGLPLERLIKELAAFGVTPSRRRNRAVQRRRPTGSITAESEPSAA
jgi:septum formation protein